MLKQYINRNLKNEFNLCTRLSSGICGDALFHFSELPNKILTPTYECMDTILPIQGRQDISKFPVYHTRIPSPQDPLSFASSSIPAIYHQAPPCPAQTLLSPSYHHNVHPIGGLLSLQPHQIPALRLPWPKKVQQQSPCPANRRLAQL